MAERVGEYPAKKELFPGSRNFKDTVSQNIFNRIQELKTQPRPGEAVLSVSTAGDEGSHTHRARYEGKLDLAKMIDGIVDGGLPESDLVQIAKHATSYDSIPNEVTSFAFDKRWYGEEYTYADWLREKELLAGAGKKE
jgi:hypothetical protein